MATYYSSRANRPDLVCVSLADPQSLQQFEVGDFIIAARGRRYFSNDALLTALHQSVSPDFRVAAGNIPSVEVYRLDQFGVGIVNDAARHMPVLVQTTDMATTQGRFN